MARISHGASRQEQVALGNQIRQHIAFKNGDFVLKRQFSLFHASHSDVVAFMIVCQFVNYIIEIAVFNT